MISPCRMWIFLLVEARAESLGTEEGERTSAKMTLEGVEES